MHCQWMKSILCYVRKYDSHSSHQPKIMSNPRQNWMIAIKLTLIMVETSFASWERWCRRLQKRKGGNETQGRLTSAPRKYFVFGTRDLMLLWMQCDVLDGRQMRHFWNVHGAESLLTPVEFPCHLLCSTVLSDSSRCGWLAFPHHPAAHTRTPRHTSGVAGSQTADWELSLRGVKI